MLTLRRTMPSRVTMRLISSSGGAVGELPAGVAGATAVVVSVVAGGCVLSGSAACAGGAGASTCAVSNGLSGFGGSVDATAVGTISGRNKWAATKAYAP